MFDWLHVRLVAQPRSWMREFVSWFQETVDWWRECLRRSMAARRRSPFVRLSLEGLEGRWTPAQRAWLGTMSTDGTDAANWQGGVRPGTGDEAIFDNRATRKFEIAEDDSLTVGKLTVASNFVEIFDVKGKLTVEFGLVTGNSTWASPSSAVALDGAGEFLIKGSGTMIFSATGVSGATTFGSVKVTHGATLKLTGASDQLQAHLTVGDGSTTGTVELGGLDGNVRASNPTSTAAPNVTVTSTGTFKMTQTGDTSSAAKGGLVQPLNAGVTPGTFTNQGTFIRDGFTSGPYDPEVDYVVTNTGTFQVKPFSNIRFTRSNGAGYSFINDDGGTVELFYLCYVRATGGYLQNGGTFQTQGDGKRTGEAVLFDMKADFLGGSLYLNRDTGNSSLEFANNSVKFSGALYIYLKVYGDSPGLSDQINIGGASTLTIDNAGANQPTLVITTVGNEPVAPWAINVMTAPNLVGTFANLDYQGSTPAGGYTVSYPAGPPRAVRLSV